eukprot:gene3967-biopygen23334
MATTAGRKGCLRGDSCEEYHSTEQAGKGLLSSGKEERWLLVYLLSSDFSPPVRRRGGYWCTSSPQTPLLRLLSCGNKGRALIHRCVSAETARCPRPAPRRVSLDAIAQPTTGCSPGIFADPRRGVGGGPPPPFEEGINYVSASDVRNERGRAQKKSCRAPKPRMHIPPQRQPDGRIGGTLHELALLGAGDRAERVAAAARLLLAADGSPFMDQPAMNDAMYGSHSGVGAGVGAGVADVGGGGYPTKSDDFSGDVPERVHSARRVWPHRPRAARRQLVQRASSAASLAQAGDWTQRNRRGVDAGSVASPSA